MLNRVHFSFIQGCARHCAVCAHEKLFWRSRDRAGRFSQGAALIVAMISTQSGRCPVFLTVCLLPQQPPTAQAVLAELPDQVVNYFTSKNILPPRAARAAPTPAGAAPPQGYAAGPAPAAAQPGYPAPGYPAPGYPAPGYPAPGYPMPPGGGVPPSAPPSYQP